jgi:Trypsin-co-occurring domain 1
MKRLVEFPSESGGPILVEVEDPGLGGETRRGLSPSAVVEHAQTSFDDALDKARPMASSLLRKLRDIGDSAGNSPEEDR